MESFGHKMFILSQPYWSHWTNTYLTKVVKEYAHIMKMPCISAYSLTTFGKEVFWLEAAVKLWWNEHFVTKWFHI